MFKYFSLFLMAFALTFTACQNKQNNEAKTAQPSCCSSSQKVEAKVYTPEELLANGSSLVDKEVALKGVVNHVCKHAGKKCFLAGESSEKFVQVLAGGKIGSFGKELIGSEITVKGVLKENRITKADIEKQEQAMKENMAKENHNHAKEGGCGHGSAKTDVMKKWMSDNNKDYYPVYFVEGLEYEKVQ